MKKNKNIIAEAFRLVFVSFIIAINLLMGFFFGFLLITTEIFILGVNIKPLIGIFIIGVFFNIIMWQIVYENLIKPQSNEVKKNVKKRPTKINKRVSRVPK